MCGRYAALRDAAEIADIFGAEELPFSGSQDGSGLPRIPNFNVTPTSEVFIVLDDFDGQRRVDSAHWGLIPSWSKDASRSSRMINARSETVAAKPAYRAAFRRRRCLVPADGYYEWQASDGKMKQPFFIHRTDERVLAFAGLYEDWEGPQGSVRSCTLLTQDARGALAAIHDRMPLPVASMHWSDWLDPTSVNAEQILDVVLSEDPTTDLTWYPVSTAVNKPANNGPALLEPIRIAGTDGAPRRLDGDDD